MENLRAECEEIVEKVCKKYHYDREDTEGNDSLRTVLLRALPAMLVDSSKEDRELFYQMLEHTPIVVTDNLTKEGLDKLEEQYIGNINQHIVSESVTVGEYGKKIGEGAYVSAPIINENMQLMGKKSFIYIQKVEGKAKEFFGTDINVSHLIHEIGHAWHAEDNEYTMEEDGTLTRRAGTVQMKSSFTKQSDGKMLQKFESTTGLFIEEGMNTIKEEEVMARYKGISKKEMRQAYSSWETGLIPSNYQGLVRNNVEYLLEKTSESDFEKWRMHGDLQAKQNIENLIAKTEDWQQRENRFPKYYEKKREVIQKIESPKVQEFFQEYENTYFPDVSKMTSLQKIDNTLEQFYNLSDFTYHIPIEVYSDLITKSCYEFYPLINQASAIKAKEEIAQSVAGVKASDIENVTSETKKGVRQMQEQKEGKVEEGKAKDE